MPAVFNWSGGKDSALALGAALASGEYEVRALLTTVSAAYRRVSQHGVREELLEAQAAALGIPLRKVVLPDEPSMAAYEGAMAAALAPLLAEGVRDFLFGDLFLADIRAYRERQLARAGARARFPLWGRETAQLAREFIRCGWRAVVVCVDDRVLDRSFAGREYDERFLADLPENVDPCGEHGEFHTFVYAGPLFREPMRWERGEVVRRVTQAPRDPAHPG